jgi:uncharacterized protein
MIKYKNKVIVKNSHICKSSWCKGIGLMFSRKKEDFGLIFEFNSPRKVSLHMFFVFYSIDVLFLDEEKKVVDIKRDFKPWTIYNSKERVKYIIELPINKVNKICLKDVINF